MSLDEDRSVEVLNALRSVEDPDLHKNVVECGFIKNLQIQREAMSPTLLLAHAHIHNDDSKCCGQEQPDASSNYIVSFEVQLTTPACPVKDSLEKQCHDVVAELQWVRAVNVNMTAKKTPSRAPKAPGLKDVSHLVAVASCKGGVGKSTIAVNLAFTLARMGASVGLFDADVHGPSLPLLVTPESTEVFQLPEKLIKPFKKHGVLMMSYGWIQPGKTATMRGAMLSRVINQLLTTTAWGQLDYLILDLPPGTGDIQLTLAQIVPLSCAVMVTTPHALSVADVDKGIEMYEKLQIPTCAIVENMSYFVCDGCDKKHELFGLSGVSDTMKTKHRIPSAVRVPLFPKLSTVDNAGSDFLSVAAIHPIIKEAFAELANVVIRELSKGRYGEGAKPRVMYDASHAVKQVIIVLADGSIYSIPTAELRRSCRCAACVVEGSGKPILDPKSISELIYPTDITPVGNYGVGIVWSDGHNTSIYTYDFLINKGGGGSNSSSDQPKSKCAADPALDW